MSLFLGPFFSRWPHLRLHAVTRAHGTALLWEGTRTLGGARHASGPSPRGWQPAAAGRRASGRGRRPSFSRPPGGCMRRMRRTRSIHIIAASPRTPPGEQPAPPARAAPSGRHDLLDTTHLPRAPERGRRRPPAQAVAARDRPSARGWGSGIRLAQHSAGRPRASHGACAGSVCGLGGACVDPPGFRMQQAGLSLRAAGAAARLCAGPGLVSRVSCRVARGSWRVACRVPRLAQPAAACRPPLAAWLPCRSMHSHCPGRQVQKFSGARRAPTLPLRRVIPRRIAACGSAARLHVSGPASARSSQPPPPIGPPPAVRRAGTGPMSTRVPLWPLARSRQGTARVSVPRSHRQCAPVRGAAARASAPVRIGRRPVRSALCRARPDRTF